MADANFEKLNFSTQGAGPPHGPRDLQGYLRSLAAATNPALAGYDLNGVCKRKWGKEKNRCFSEVQLALFFGTLA